MKNKKRGSITDAIALDGEVEMDKMYLGTVKKTSTIVTIG